MAQTDNYNLPLMATGTEVGTWGVVQNNGIFTPLDSILGATFPVTITVADVTLTVTQFQSAVFLVTGTLTGDRSLIIPLSPNSATVACGGKFIVVNGTAGAYNLTVKTVASGSVGVVVPQGTACALYSNGTDVGYDNNGNYAVVKGYAGNPNGHVAGTAASVNTPASVIFDYTNLVLYVCTTTGDAASALWTNVVASGAPLPTPQGYLTPVSNTPIIASDSIAATAVYYTPYKGAWAAVHNGSAIIAYQFSQLQLTLTTSQAASNIYDVFLAYNGGTPVIGTGPSWAAGSGGSVTAGSCVRGTGAGGTSINRASPSGLWVNTVSMSLIWNTGSGNTTITVGVGQGIYLGSLFIDGTAGQITCHRGFGQSRKWSVYNAYNQNLITLLTGDSTASWPYASAPVRASNGSSSNNATPFMGLADGEVEVNFTQYINANGGTTIAGIGWNATNAFSGTVATMTSVAASVPARYTATPALGINIAYCCEQFVTGSSATYNGTQANMCMETQWWG